MPIYSQNLYPEIRGNEDLLYQKFFLGISLLFFNFLSKERENFKISEFYPNLQKKSIENLEERIDIGLINSTYPLFGFEDGTSSKIESLIKIWINVQERLSQNEKSDLITQNIQSYANGFKTRLNSKEIRKFIIRNGLVRVLNNSRDLINFYLGLKNNSQDKSFNSSLLELTNSTYSLLIERFESDFKYQENKYLLTFEERANSYLGRGETYISMYEVFKDSKYLDFALQDLGQVEEILIENKELESKLRPKFKIIYSTLNEFKEKEKVQIFNPIITSKIMFE